MDRAEMYAFMNSHRYGLVSSVNSQGSPESALVGIAVTPALEIIFDTLKTSRKYANLTAHPACSFVIGWENEQTLQYEGQAFVPGGVGLQRYQQTYFEAWPDGPERLTWPGIVHFVVQPQWLRWSDYGASPPVVEELKLG